MKETNNENMCQGGYSCRKELPIEDWDKEEWGGWKIVSDMLDHPDELGIYPTSKCYKELYDFVCKQKAKAYEQCKSEISFCPVPSSKPEKCSWCSKTGCVYPSRHKEEIEKRNSKPARIEPLDIEVSPVDDLRLKLILSKVNEIIKVLNNEHGN